MEIENIPQNDWELMDDYYQKDNEMPELRIEDFMDEETSENSSFGEVQAAQKARIDKIVEDVHQVLLLAKDGKTVEEIAAELGLKSQYVYDIQVSAQGFREDDEIAVAHLVHMSMDEQLIAKQNLYFILQLYF